MTFKNRIAGLIRFSYPALSGFSVKPDDPSRLQAMLYDRPRLERRFALFEALCLPSLLAQSDPDFETLILVGTDLPDWARDRLLSGIAPLGARLVALPPMHHYPAVQTAFASLADRGHSHLTSFRLDDDDALDRDHIARLRRIAQGVAAFTATPFAVTQNRGLFVDLTGKEPQFVEATEKMPLSVGVALCAPAGYGDNIFRRNHRLLPQFFTTFSDATEMAYLRSIHGGNDSTAHTTGVVTDRSPAEASALLGAHFATTPAMLNRLVSALRS
ncbi:glycosyltransferase [Paragemmobacter straminiformis]|uniref:Rhamnosyl transferase n=1 Tax=Paragemmobacter straminiformis TaxID=2045119 RepID=A0A842IBZ7_9RHOB|nr:glycosyltransferase [Gemmobacter straminiformis]MBC2836943.1 hypothetical protein [Gemmobacter straminiformis]